MKSQSQLLMVALAVIFAAALALTVALICLAMLPKSTSEESLPPESPEPSTPHNLTNPITVPSSILPVTTAPITPPAPLGLAFESHGNGTCSVLSLGNLTDAFVVIPEKAPNGDTVTEIAPRAFMGAAHITAIQIPKTVTKIGELAFADCPNLIYISVDAKNIFFSDVDGVLYSKNGTTLLLYPPMRAGSSFYLPSTVTYICDMAFYNCAYLTSIVYGGTPQDWEYILIGQKNYSLISASVSFSAA